MTVRPLSCMLSLTLKSNECKRRKIKCNGQNPCQRCGNLNLDCVYAPNCCNGFKESEEYGQITDNVSELQHQVQLLFANFSSLKAFVESRPDPSLELPIQTPSLLSVPSPATQSQNQNTPKYPRFHGPTSAAFGLGVAKSSLTRNFGITGLDENGEELRITNEASPSGTPPPFHTNTARPVESRDVIWSITKEEALRLVNVWKEQIHIMYPVVDMDKIIAYTHQLYSTSQTDAIYTDDETTTLRLVMANAVELESGGSSQFGLEVFRNVAPVIESIMMRAPSFKSLEHLILAVSSAPLYDVDLTS